MDSEHEYIDPEISDAMFEISTQRDTAYAQTAEGAYAAYWALWKDAGVQGTKVRIVNLVTGQIVIQ